MADLPSTVMTGSMRHRGGDSWELRVYLGRHPDTGKERWATRTVHGSRRHAGEQLRLLVEEAHAARIHAGTVAELLERWFASGVARLVGVDRAGDPQPAESSIRCIGSAPVAAVFRGVG